MSGNTIIKISTGFEIYFPYSQRIVEAVKSIPGRRFDANKKAWYVPEGSQFNLVQFAKQYGFTFNTNVEKNMSFELPPLPELKISIPLKMNLFPYQRTGVAYALEKKRVIIGDEPGLGKTAQSIATIIAANAFPCLVIAPATLKENWRREWELWTGKRARVMDEKLVKYHERYLEAGLGVDVWITNYESLGKWFVSDIRKPDREKLRLNHIHFWPLKDIFKSVIIDEFHKCKSTSTKQSKLVKGIAHGKEYIIGLTGTPVVNKPKDLVSQLGIIDHLGTLGGYRNFVNYYCAGDQEASNLKELNYHLSLNCFIRRDKRTVLKDLPAKMRQVVYCSIDTRKEYEDAQSSLENYLRDYCNASDAQIQRSMRGEVMVRIGKLKNISARGKMAEVSEFIDDILESGEKLVIFAHLHDIFHELKRRYPDAVSVTGEDDNLERQRAIDRFQKHPACKLILCSIKAAGVGITLTASSRVAFIELPWHAADAEQCEDRCHRIGQSDSVQCTYFLGNDTIDQWNYDIITRKRLIANQVTGKEDEIQEKFIDNIINLFTKKII